MRDVYLKTPLNRGKFEALAGEIVSVQDGLAHRLIDRGQACDPKDAPKADAKPAPKAKAKGDDKGDGKAPAKPE